MWQAPHEIYDWYMRVLRSASTVIATASLVLGLAPAAGAAASYTPAAGQCLVKNISTTRQAQTFTADGDIDRVQFPLVGNNASAQQSGEIVVEIWTTDAPEAGTKLATSNPVSLTSGGTGSVGLSDYTYNLGSFSWWEFTFPTTVTLVTGDPYSFVIRPSAANTSPVMGMAVCEMTTSPAYTGGAHKSYDNTGPNGPSWVTMNGDIPFRSSAGSSTPAPTPVTPAYTG